MLQPCIHYRYAIDMTGEFAVGIGKDSPGRQIGAHTKCLGKDGSSQTVLVSLFNLFRASFLFFLVGIIDLR